MDRKDMTKYQAAWLLLAEPGVIVGHPELFNHKLENGKLFYYPSAYEEWRESHMQSSVLFSESNYFRNGWFVVETPKDPLDELLPLLEETHEGCREEAAEDTLREFKALVAILDKRYQLKEDK